MFKENSKLNSILVILILITITILTLVAWSNNNKDAVSEQNSDGVVESTNVTDIEEVSNSTEVPSSGDIGFDVNIPKINLNDFGGSPIDIFSMVVNGDLPIISLVEEFNMVHYDEAYIIVMVTDTDEYKLSISAPNKDLDMDEFLDYSKTNINVTSLNNDWSIDNPSTIFIEENIKKPYLDQVRTIDKPNANNMTKSTYATYYNVLREKTYIELDDGLIDSIIEQLNSIDKEVVNYDEYENTDDYFFKTDIYIYFEDKDSEISKCDILMNEKGMKTLKFVGETNMVVATELCETIISVVKTYTDWSYIALKDIKDIVNAEIYLDEKVIASLTEVNKLNELQKLLSNARCIGHTPKTMMYKPIMKLILENGNTITLQLDLENDLMLLGSSFHYDYGPGYNGGDSINMLPNLLELFSLESFEN